MVKSMKTTRWTKFLGRRVEEKRSSQLIQICVWKGGGFVEVTQSSRNLFQVCRTKCPAVLQCSAGHSDPRADSLLNWWLANIMFYAGHLLDIFRALNPAGQNVRQCWNPLPDISRSLPDMSGMSGIFREDWEVCTHKSGGLNPPIP